MKKLFYMAVAAIAVLSSCSQEEAIETSNQQEVIFTATLDNSDTRVTLGDPDDDGNIPVEFQYCENLWINGMTYVAFPSNDDPTQATLEPTVEGQSATFDGSYRAISAFCDSEGTGNYVLPAVQYYDSYTNSNLPIYAYTTTDTHELTFKNICAVLAVNVPVSEYWPKVNKITVKADYNIRGSFKVDENFNAVSTVEEAVTYEPEEHTVTLDCDDVEITENKTFYIAVIPNTCYNLTITVTNAEGESYDMPILLMSEDGFTLQRSMIYKVSFMPAL